MTWQIPLLISSTLGIVRDSITKRITQKVDPLIALFYFYITAVGTASLIALYAYKVNPFAMDSSHWWARVFGMAFGVGVYGMFHAIRISLVKTQVFGNYRNLVTIILAALFLGEFTKITIFTVIALVIFITSLVIPTLKSSGSLKIQSSDKEWVIWMLINIVLVGSGLFFVKLFTGSLTPIDILVNQYIGSFVAISLIIGIRGAVDRKSMEKSPIIIKDRKLLLLILGNGIITACSLFFLYSAISLGPVSTITQVDNFLRTLFVIPIGLFMFHEQKQMDAYDYVSIALALAGALILIFL